MKQSDTATKWLKEIFTSEVLYKKLFNLIKNKNNLMTIIIHSTIRSVDFQIYLEISYNFNLLCALPFTYIIESNKVLYVYSSNICLFSY